MRDLDAIGAPSRLRLIRMAPFRCPANFELVHGVMFNDAKDGKNKKVLETNRNLL